MTKKDNMKTSYECYKDFLKNSICDEKIKDELLEQLKRFYDEGILVFCGKDLCGKIRNIKGDDYLEIKCGGDSIVCSYSKYNFRKKINIIQSKINDIVKVERKETSNCYNSEGVNQSQNIELERVYNSKSDLLYESLLTDNSYGRYLPIQIAYKDKTNFSNKLCLNRKWFYDNGSIIHYKLSKDFFSGDSNIKESYSICVKPYRVNCVMVYDLEPIDVSLFKKVMLQEISIEDVIEQMNIQKVKKIGGNINV